jgi:DNA relaxase NicK
MQQNLLIDYLVISFKVRPDQSDCFTRFLVKYINFPVNDAEKIKSYYGFSECLYYAGMKLHIDRNLVVLDMSGKGCRTCEQLNEGWNWYQFLNTFDRFLTKPIKDSDYGTKGQFAVHISRLDLACDLLKDNRITVPFLQNYVQKHKFLCKSDYHSCVVGNYEMSVYFGSPRSDRRLRIYDKALEQGIQDGTKWVRFEFQLRNDNALSFYLNLSQTCQGDFSKCYYGMLHDYLRFLTQVNDGMNSNRKTICPFG